MRGKIRKAYADAAGYLCEYRTDIEMATGGEQWQAALSVIRDAEPFSEPWAEALRAAHAAAETAGIPGGLGLGRTMGGFPDPREPFPPCWKCPDGRCSRIVVTDPSPEGEPGPAPLCALSGRPMRRSNP